MATDWTTHANEMWKFWTEGQKAWLESLSRSPASATLPFASAPGAQEMAQQLNDAWKASIDQWMAFLQQGTARVGFSQEHLRKIVDPAEWAKPVPGSFDFGIERLIEGPTFATLWDLDRKLAKLQQLAMQRAEDSAAYHTVVLAAWNRALERFARDLADRERPPVASFRELIDLWIKTANDTLIEVHRSPQFLEAQRRVTRSATDYRLAEREIAEAYCEIHHIPTRTEVDEVQRALHDLRRDVRALVRRLDGGGGESGAGQSRSSPSASRERTKDKPRGGRSR
jgi:hypothetical protein